MAINTLSNISSQEIRLTATKTITSGQLIALTEGGPNYPVSTSLPLSVQNVTTAGSSSVFAYQNVAPTQTYQTFQGDYNSLVQLGNGVLALAYAGNGSITSSAVNVSFFTQNGGAYQPAVQPTTTSSITSVRIRKINSTSFVVGYLVGTSLRFAIYNNDGTVVKAETTVATVQSGSPLYWNFSVNINGDIIFAYFKVTTNDLAFQRFNSLGTLQGAEVIVQAASSPLPTVILSHSSGDFWIHFYNSSAGGYRFAKFNSAGVIQGSVTVLSNSGSSFVSNYNKSIVELSNGNVLMWWTNASDYPCFSIYTNSGTLVTSNAVWTNNSGSNAVPRGTPGFFTSTAGFNIATLTTGSLVRRWALDNSGNFIGGGVSSAFASTNISTGANAGSLDLYEDGGTGWTVFCSGYSGSTYSAHLFSMSNTGATLGTAVSLFTAQAAVTGPTSLRSEEGLICLSIAESTGAVGVKMAIYNSSRKSIIGVAQESAAIGATYRCATSGTFTITNPPLTPGYWDARTATPGGCRGTIAGTTAILNGTT